MESLLWILVFANAPLYFVYARWTFGTWGKFGECVGAFFLHGVLGSATRLIQIFSGDADPEGQVDKFLFLWWILGCVVTVAGEYYAIRWFMRG